VANRHGFVASFMPKPIMGQNGSGMHTHQSLFRGKDNAFFDPKTDHQLSAVALSYVEGLLQHARGFCAITNPLINSYKRLVPGYEAPVNVAWSMRNRSPLVRIPERRGVGTRCELRMPDPSANPYLSLAVQFAAGLDGVVQKLECREPVNRNIFRMSYRDRRQVPDRRPAPGPARGAGSLREGRRDQGGPGRAPDRALPRSEAGGGLRYNTQVTRWEVENYLGRY
jgi:glutamine synthetase